MVKETRTVVIGTRQGKFTKVIETFLSLSHQSRSGLSSFAWQGVSLPARNQNRVSKLMYVLLAFLCSVLMRKEALCLYLLSLHFFIS
jgi:hypothetical protein